MKKQAKIKEKQTWGHLKFAFSGQGSLTFHFGQQLASQMP